MPIKPTTYLDLEAALDGEYLHAGGAAATRLLLEALGLRPGSLILEIGCGTGATSIRLMTDYDCRVVGLDLSVRMLKQAHRKIRRDAAIYLVQADAAHRSLPFGAATFDVVLAESVAGILDFGTCLPEWVRVLQPGGMLALNDGLWKADAPSEIVAKFASLSSKEFGYSLAPRTHQTIEDWRRMLASAGLIGIRALAVAKEGGVIGRDPDTERRRRRTKIRRPHLWPALLRYRRSMKTMAEVGRVLEYWIILAQKPPGEAHSELAIHPKGSSSADDTPA